MVISAPRMSPSVAVSPLSERDQRNLRCVALLELARTAPADVRRRIQQRVVLDYADVARAVANRYRAPGLEYADLCQVAYLGLTKAVQRFEPERGGDIVSFAVPTISGEIKRHLRDNSWSVRPPRSLQENWAELRRAAEALAQVLGHEPSNADLAQATGHSVSFIVETKRCADARHAVSLDSPRAGYGRENASLGELLRGDDERRFEQVELAAMVAAAFDRLGGRERMILRLRYFEDRTQDEIAAELGISQMQVSRLLRRILGKMRVGLRAAQR